MANELEIFVSRTLTHGAAAAGAHAGSSAHRRRALVGVTIAGAALLSPLALAPSPATASPITYLESTCSVSSVSPTGGLNGDGCTTWGVPHTVTIGGSGSGPLPESISKPIIECAREGSIAFVKAWTDVDKYIPPQYKKAGSFAYFAVGCVEGAAQAMSDLGNL